MRNLYLLFCLAVLAIAVAVRAFGQTNLNLAPFMDPLSNKLPVAPMRTITTTNHFPPTPNTPAHQSVISFTVPLVTPQLTITTNSDGTTTVCYPVGFVFPRNGRVVTNAYCITNIPATPFNGGISLTWQEQPSENPFFTLSPLHIWMTNVILYSTNSANGPWTGSILIPVTNGTMNITVTINPAIQRCFFKLSATNLW